MKPRWRFQAALHRALGAWLAGADFTRASRVLYPLSERCRPELAEVAGAAAECNVLLPLARPSRCFAAACRALDDLPPPDASFREFVLPGFDPGRHGRIASLARVRERLLERARRGGFEVFLHGSYATLDFTAYSDLDLLVLLPRTAAGSPASLRAIRREWIAAWRELKEFDPLQHHGPFFLTEMDLRGYPAPLFPESVWERTMALEERPRILRLRAIPEPELARGRFTSMAERFCATDLRRGRTNAYRCKSDLSVFMLLPALWCQARGDDVGKRESFGRIGPRLSEGARRAFARASEIREAWTYAEPAAHRLLRRCFWNPLLPASVDAARSDPPAEGVRGLLDDAFLAGAHAAARELLSTLDPHGGPRPRTPPAHDRVA